MKEDEGRVKDTRKMSRARKEQATRESAFAHKKTKKPRKGAVASPNKRVSNRAVPGPVETTIKLGRSLRTGSAYVVKVSRKAYDEFNAFTQGDPSAGKPGKRKGPAKAPISRNLTFVIFLVSIFAILSVALMVLNNSSVSVEKQPVSVVGLPKDLEGYNILVVSDLHGRSFGTGQTALLRTINGLRYDLVVYAGDMVGNMGDPQPFYDLLDGITGKKPAYFIAGDSDPAPLMDAPRDIAGATLSQMVLSDWVLGAQARGATYLSATAGVPVGATTLWLSPVGTLSVNIQRTLQEMKDQVEQLTEGTISGLEGDRASLPIADYRYHQMMKADEAVHQMSADQLHLAVSHYPPSQGYIEITQQLGQESEEKYTYLPTVDMVLAGHYCGGGWKLPFLGALYVPNDLLPRHGWFPQKAEVEGLRQLGATQVYTSPGLSVTDKIKLPNFRLFNPPTITVLTLTSAIVGDMLGEK
ncbi:MAG: metallophosphoesterase [Clostridia bacterium]